MKVLIFKQRSSLAPTGGPNGYLYNLMAGFEKVDDSSICIEFLPESSNKSIKKTKFWKIIRKYIKILIDYKKINNMLYSTYSNDKIEFFNNYDLIHFHSTEDLYRSRVFLKNYKGKVLLTSHSPKPFFMEFMDSLSCFEKKLFKKKLQRIEAIDEFAFNRSDFLIFPCIEAEEPYYNLWGEKYKVIHENNINKYRYIPTGITFNYECKIDVKSKYGIPKDAFVISYVGRHNEVKGYDILKEVGKILLKKHDNLYFIVAGVEKPIKGLNHPRWIEVGWTREPYAYISVSDCFVLPNRQTYFDIIMLEVLALSKVVVASYTGGNKYFEKYDDSGIIFYNSINECVDNIEKLMRMSHEEIENLANANKLLFEKDFNEIVFAKKYIELYKSLK